MNKNLESEEHSKLFYFVLVLGSEIKQLEEIERSIITEYGTDLSWEEKFSACLLSAYGIESGSAFLTLPKCVLILDGLDEITATSHCRE